MYIPITISRDDIVDPQLLADLLNAQMQSVRLKLLASEVGHDHGGQTHQTCCLVLLLVTPAVALLAPFDAIGRRISCFQKNISIDSKTRIREGELTSNWTAATLRSIGQGRRNGATLIFLITPEATTPQRDIVGTCDSLVAPRHGFC